MKTKRVSLTVTSAERMANNSIRVNGQHWFQGFEVSQSMMRQGIGDPFFSTVLLEGATIQYDELLIEAEDIANGPYKFQLARPIPASNGRPERTHIEFKNIGPKNMNPVITLGDFVAERLTDKSLDRAIEMADKRRAARPTRGATSNRLINTQTNAGGNGAVVDDFVEDPQALGNTGGNGQPDPALQTTGANDVNDTDLPAM